MVDVAEWLIEHWKTLTASGLIAVILRELTKHMVNRTVEEFINPQAKAIREIKRNLQIVQHHMGVEGEWSGEGLTYERVRRSLSQYFALFSKVILRKIFRLRRKNMQNINWITLIPSLFGVAKLILQPLGVDLSHITNEQVNDIANGVAALLAVIGVFLSHQKQEGGKTNVTPQYTGDHGPAV